MSTGPGIFVGWVCRPLKRTMPFHFRSAHARSRSASETDLARIAQHRGIRFIGFRHEGSAGNAAAIAGFLAGKPGVSLTVPAPGFLNGLVSLAAATVNAFPMIMMSGSSEREIVALQRGDHQKLDQYNAAKPFAKAAFRVDRREDIGLAVARAVRTAVSGRPAGVYLDLPAKTLSAVIDAQRGAESITLDFTDPDDFAFLQKLIAKADVVIENFRPGSWPS